MPANLGWIFSQSHQTDRVFRAYFESRQRRHHRKSVNILQTERTILRHISTADAEFMLDLLNQPSFIKYIGDRNVRTLGQAAEYIENRILESYEKFGFSMYLVELKSPKPEQIGVSGFVQRPHLPQPDIGFAFLPQFCGKGYALESAKAMMTFGRETLNLTRVLAITTPDNDSSVRLLEKLGFEFEKLFESPDGEELNLFSAELADVQQT